MNDTRNTKSGKKGSPLGIFLVLFLVVLFSAIGDSEEAVVAVIGIAMLALPIVLFVLVVRAVVKKAQRSEPTGHSHDRIDHSSDLKINPKTGKVSHAPVRSAQPHSPQEHWKQQLDALLANGTIDRAEYRSMMNRKF